MIYICGSTRANTNMFFRKNIVGMIKPGDYLLVCGNFEYVVAPENTILQIFENEELDKLATLPYTILFIDGILDKIERLNKMPLSEWKGGKIHKIRHNIFHLMRGQVYEIDGKTIFTMGGGRSYESYVNPYYGKDLLYPSNDEIKEAWSNLDRHQMRVDYMVTYSIPLKVVLQDRPLTYVYEGETPQFLDDFFDNVKYANWYIGAPLCHNDNLEKQRGWKYAHKKKFRGVSLDPVPLYENE